MFEPNPSTVAEMAVADPTPQRVTPATMKRLTAELERCPLDERDRLVEEFWAAARRSGTPLVESAEDDPYRHEVTFLWRGCPDTDQDYPNTDQGDPDTDQVVLVMSGLDRDRPQDAALDRIPGTDIWYAGYRLRSDQRSSYRFAVGRRCDDVDEQPAGADAWRRMMMSALADPLNPATLPGRWGQRASSILALPAAPVDTWARAEVDHDQAGSLVRHRLHSASLDGERDVWVYRPPKTADHDRPDHGLPVLVLCDGDRWFAELDLRHTLDAMISSRALPPVIVLAPDSVDLRTRWRELSAHEPYLAFLADELLPWAAGRWHLTDDPARTVIAGQSLGGLTALYAGLRRPERFGALLAQSPSLWWHPGLRLGNPHPAGVERCWLADQFAGTDRLPTEVDLQTGLLEGQLVSLGRELDGALRNRGVPLTRTEFNGGHDYACWRNGLTAGLQRLLRDPSRVASSR